MKSLAWICATTSLASQELEDRDGAAMLQMQTRRMSQQLNKQNVSGTEDCAGKDIWYWHGNHKQNPTLENGDFIKNPDGSYKEWTVMSSENFAMQAKVVSYATTAGKTCSHWCQATHNLPCVRGMDDAHHQSDRLTAESGTRCSVYPGGHERKATTNAGCDQTWHTQMCACDEMEDILVTPPAEDEDPQLCVTTGYQLLQQPGYGEPVLPGYGEAGEPVLTSGFHETQVTPSYCFPDTEDAMAEHVNLQLKQESITAYDPNNKDRNGRHGPFRQINIRSGTNTTFRFMASVPGHRLTENSFTFKMYDIDMGNTAGGARESFILCGEHARKAEIARCGDDVTCETNGDNCAALCSGETECKVLTATKAGYGCDNVLVDSKMAPESKELLKGVASKPFKKHCKSWWGAYKNTASASAFGAQTMAEVGDVNHPIQQARSVELKFTNAAEFEMAFATTSGNGGRNFLYQIIIPKRQICHVDPSVPDLIPQPDVPEANCVEPSDNGPGENEEPEPDYELPDLPDYNIVEPETVAPTPAPITPEQNCPLPGTTKDDRRACHFWGEPHFTHVFQNPISDDLAKGAASKRGVAGRDFTRLQDDFQGSGVYNFAAADGFSSQVYFCPAGDTQTSVGAAIAMRMGDTTISMVRHPATKGTSGTWKYADLNGRNEDEYYTLRVTDSSGSREVQVSQLTEESKAYSGGNTVWMQKTSISTWHPQSKADNWGGVSKAAVCVGNNPLTAIVDVSVPNFKEGVNWDIFYEMAVTVTVDKSKMHNSGICGIEDFLTGNNFDEARPASGSELLFSESELDTLHDLCGVGWTGSATKFESAAALCARRYVDYEQVKSNCEQDFEGDNIWSRACIVEECAGASREWIKAVIQDEEDYEEQLSLDIPSY